MILVTLHLKLLLPATLALHDCNVTIDGEIREPLSLPAWIRPLYFHPVNLGPLAQPQNNTRIMGGEVAAPTHFPLMAQRSPD